MLHGLCIILEYSGLADMKINIALFPPMQLSYGEIGCRMEQH